MKEWSKPQLFSLGVENTFEDVEPYAPRIHNGYCHAEDWQCTGLVNDHSADGHKGHTYTGEACPEHGPGNEACCCFQS